jgi:hypothetical protein
MAKTLTQTKCRKSFANLAESVIIDIDDIDKETPAGPVEEPSWWVEMMDIQRKLIAWRKRHAH